MLIKIHYVLRLYIVIIVTKQKWQQVIFCYRSTVKGKEKKSGSNVELAQVGVCSNVA